jgi:hypothetical protein
LRLGGSALEAETDATRRSDELAPATIAIGTLKNTSRRKKSNDEAHNRDT